MDAEKQRSNLDYLARFAGWGEPRSDLWFVALEEGSEADEKYVLKIQGLEPQCGDPAYAGLIVERPIDLPGQDEGPGPSTTERAEKEIVEALLGRTQAVSWRQLRFHANLNCLGYNRSQKPFPSNTYGPLVGVQSLDDEAYVAAQTLRWQALKKMRELLGPQGPKAVVCLGLTATDDFRKALAPSDVFEIRKSANRRFLISEASRMIIAPHPSYGNLRRVQDVLIDQLRDWGVFAAALSN